MKTYTYICIAESPLWHEGRPHIRMANSKRLPVLEQRTSRLRIFELPRAMTRIDAIRWLRQHSPESLPRKHQTVTVTKLLEEIKK